MSIIDALKRLGGSKPSTDTPRPKKRPVAYRAPYTGVEDLAAAYRGWCFNPQYKSVPQVMTDNGWATDDEESTEQ